MTHSATGTRGVGSLRVPCALCGKEVRRSPSRLKKTNGRAYCDTTCRDRDRPNRTFAKRSDTGKAKAPTVTEPCSTCGKPVTRRITDARPRLFCGRPCYFESVRREGRAGRPQRRQPGDRMTTAEGYTFVFVGRGEPMANSKGYVAEHRMVMARLLGRALLPSEDVHHRNGMSGDNRASNLELWTRDHPHGARVTDLAAWARAFLAQYESDLDHLS